MDSNDQDLLRAALVGYEARRAEIEKSIANVRSQLGQRRGPGTAPAPKRHMSAAGRRAISLAQKARWRNHRRLRAA